MIHDLSTQEGREVHVNAMSNKGKKVVLMNTQILDGMYMDIQSIEIEIDVKEYDKIINKCRKVLKENGFLSSVSVRLFGKSFFQTIKFFDSTADDKEKTENVTSRIDTEMLIVYPNGVYYRGFNKWTSDFLEVELTNL